MCQVIVNSWSSLDMVQHHQKAVNIIINQSGWVGGRMMRFSEIPLNPPPGSDSSWVMEGVFLYPGIADTCQILQCLYMIYFTYQLTTYVIAISQWMTWHATIGWYMQRLSRGRWPLAGCSAQTHRLDVLVITLLHPIPSRPPLHPTVLAPQHILVVRVTEIQTERKED